MDKQSNVSREAASYYNLPKLYNKDPSQRYIYLLPKTHKSITEWRSMLHPKMRPIVSDTNSFTYNLSKHLLPYLQKIENLFSTTITTSLSVYSEVMKINNLPSKCITSKTLLMTVDVESLFTRIPQDQLLQIINYYIQ